MADSRLTIRPAVEADAALIVRLIRGLAEHEGRADLCTVTEANIREHVFGPRPFCEVVIAEDAAGPAGLALFFLYYATFYYATFAGQPGLYLEDLFVLPERRGRGIGQALLGHLARIALERGCGRMGWGMVRWNEAAVRFYERLGAEQNDDHVSYVLAGAALRKVARANWNKDSTTSVNERPDRYGPAAR